MLLLLEMLLELLLQLLLELLLELHLQQQQHLCLTIMLHPSMTGLIIMLTTPWQLA